MRTRMVFRRFALLFLLVGISCYSDDCSTVEPDATGGIQVTIVTTGGQPDPDGYNVVLGNVTLRAAVNDQVRFENVRVGGNTVTLTDLAPNCGMPWLPANPPSRMVDVVGGQTVAADFDVLCPILASLDITITGLPPGVPADVQVSNLPTLYSRRIQTTLTQSTKLTSLWPSYYSIEANTVRSGGISYSSDVFNYGREILEGETSVATIQYSGGTSTLYLVVAGLPAGVDADITVTGPAGFQAKPTSSTSFASVDVGTYTIVAASVTTGNGTYTPEPASQTVTVVANEAVTATVSYRGPPRPPIVLQDDFSAGTQWQETVAGSTGGATSTVETRTSGGVSGGFRHMTHVFDGPGSISVYHVYTGGSYDPKVLGAIEAINYSEWRIEFSPPFSGAAIGSRFLVLQNGVAYTAPIGGASAFTDLTWTIGEALQLKPTDFTPAGLDFSNQGGEISFGYLRSNTTNSRYTTVHGIDDWRVEIVRVQN